MKHYIVTGMSCAACQARVENAVAKVERILIFLDLKRFKSIIGCFVDV